MYDKVVPRLYTIEFFQENSFKHSDEPVYEGNEWYIQGFFFVKDVLTENYNTNKPFYKRRRGNKGGDLGHAFPFVICSEGFAKSHDKNFLSDKIMPIIMKQFSTTAATELISNKIQSAGDYITIEALWKHLSTFADVTYDS